MKGFLYRLSACQVWDRFEKQPIEYKESILPKNTKARIGIEMGSSIGWREYVGDNGAVHCDQSIWSICTSK